jgi:hypothetical protein
VFVSRQGNFFPHSVQTGSVTHPVRAGIVVLRSEVTIQSLMTTLFFVKFHVLTAVRMEMTAF